MRFARPAILLAGFFTLAQAVLAGGPAIGSAAPTFTLTTLDGKSFSLAEAARSHKAVVVMFIATKCPYSNAYNDRMRDMAAAYEKKGVLFAGINSLMYQFERHKLIQRTTAGRREKAQEAVARALELDEVFVIDPEGKLRYHGRIDENYEDPSKVTSPDLKNALESLLAGQPIAKAETKAFGCSIKRV